MACYDPATARLSAEAFSDRTGRYVFVSTVSVYASHATTEAQLEDAPLEELTPGAEFPDSYGPNKALAEGGHPGGLRRPGADRPAGADQRPA